jgi:hypothetical protein
MRRDKSFAADPGARHFIRGIRSGDPGIDAESIAAFGLEGSIVMPTKEAQATKHQPKQTTPDDREQARKALQTSMDMRQ